MSFDIAFEINMNEGSILLENPGEWSSQIKANCAYDYNTVLNSFVDSYVDRDERDSLKQQLSLSVIANSGSLNRHLINVEFHAILPGTEEYEWFQICILTSQSNKSHGIIQNINSEREEAAAVQHRADHDSLTDLLNRSAFERETAPIFAKDNESGFFMICDIDNFKEVNDSKGHHYGDCALCCLADSIRRSLPPSAILGRFGGDEFVAFCPGSFNESQITAYINGVRESCASGNVVAPFTISIGISLFPEHGRAMSLLLTNSDRALYFVKQNGKNNMAIFREDMPPMQKHETTAIVALSDKQPAAKHSTATSKLARVIRRYGKPILITVLVIAFGLMLTAALYLEGLDRLVKQRNADFAAEIASTIGASVTDDFDSALETLLIISSMAEDIEFDSAEEMSKYISSAADGSVFHAVMIFYESGGCLINGYPSPHPDASNAANAAVMMQEPYISEALVRSSSYVRYYAVPITPKQFGGSVINAIGGYISMADLGDTICRIQDYDETGRAYIVDEHGTILASSDNATGFVAGAGIYQALNKYRLPVSITTNYIKAQLNDEQSGSLLIQTDNGKCILNYTPMDIGGWSLFTILPSDCANVNSHAFIRITLLACLAVALIIGGAACLILMEQQRVNRHIERLAYRDLVTGGMSRARFLRDAKEFIGDNASKYSIIYANIDHFKLLNERYGRPAADAALTYMNKIFSAQLAADELCARLASDHFVILIGTQDYFELTEYIREWNRNIVQYGRSLDMNYTIVMNYGIYQVTEPQLAIDTMTDCANSARKSVLGTVRDDIPIGLYDTKLRENLREEQEMEAHMDTALEAGEFRMFLQPQYNITTGKVDGFEALARWQHGNRLLLPNRFIPLFERNGFIIKLDLYMFTQACRTIRDLISIGRPPVRISVNVSRVHLLNDNFLPQYVNIWKRYGIPAECIDLEFTETVVFNNSERLNRIISDIHKIGFTCSMDDFGSGYSSLNLLHDINVDVIKLDKSFLGKDSDVLSERSICVIRGIIDITRQLQLKTVVEGVETMMQYRFLRECGVDVIQGFLCSKPLPVKQALTKLEENQSFAPGENISDE